MIAAWDPHGGIPNFVRTLYQNVLDREAESQEVVNHHTNAAYDSGLAAMITGFFNSPEYRAKNRSTDETVKKLYRSILGREAEAGGLEYHVREINRGMSMDEAVLAFVNSAEYSQKVQQGLVPTPQPSHIADYIRTLYRNVLDREAESQDVVDHHTKAAYDNGLATAIAGFFNSPEYCAKNLSTEETVRKIYRSIGREAEAGVLEYHVREINQGRSVNETVAAIMNDAE